MFGFVEVNGRVVGSKARYKCQKGYHLIGSEERVCQADGSWSRTPPECRENLYCTDPPVIPHAKHDSPSAQTRYEVNHTLQYTCDEGYVTGGFTAAKCFLYNGTMQWFGPKIKCNPKSCGDPGDIVNGFKEGACYKYSCRVTYNCRPGFELVGRPDYYCQHDGTWNPREIPSCKAVQCETPDNPENGKVIYTTKSYNSVVTYECSYGFMIVGSATRRCGPNKKWTDEKPECREINCGSSGVLYNGWIEGSKTTLYAVVHFRCFEGMTFEGRSNRAVCSSNGTWSEPLPHCYEINCGSPGHLSNGWVENLEKGTSLGASIIFRCFPNMTLEGDDTSVCQSNGKWNTPLPKCLAPCIVPTIKHGRVNNTQTGEKVPHGFQLNVTCNPTFELAFGNVPPTCFNGTWSRYPHCNPARCKTLPPRPRHGMVIVPKSDHGTKARFRCKDGYRLEGSQTTECQFGNWTGRPPLCQEVYCPFPGTVENGRVLLVGNMGMYDYRDYVQKVKNNRQIRYKCDRGFYLVNGPPGATCVAGRWSPDKLPQCKPDLHPRMKWIKKRSLNFSELLNSEENDEEFKNTSDPDTTEVPPTLANEISSMKPDTITKDTPVLAETKGGESLVNPLGRKHSFFPDFSNVLRRGASLDSSEEDEVVDKEEKGREQEESRGKEPSENDERRNHPNESAVEEGDSQSPEGVHEEGERRPKREITVPGRGAEEISSSHRSRWGMLGKEERKRLQTEHWKRRKKGRGKAFAHCHEIKDDAYTTIEILHRGRDANYTFSSGARVKVTCLHSYAQDKIIKCSHGKWKPRNPKCSNPPCTVPPTSHGEFTYKGQRVLQNSLISHGELVKFSCHPGFNLQGSDTMRCYYGNWAVTGMNPECHPMLCTLPEYIPHGRYDMDYTSNFSVSYGNSVEYSCDPGWRKVALEIRCLVEGLSPTNPHCVLDPVVTLNIKRVEPITVSRMKAKRSTVNSYGVRRAKREASIVPVRGAMTPIDGTENLTPHSRRVVRDVVLDKEERKRLRMERREQRKLKRRKKGRGKAFAHCEEIKEEAYMKVEIIRQGRDDNYTFSSGARLKVTCLHGYGLNIGNKTAKCARGRWKPMRPKCFNLPCTVPATDHGEFRYNGERVMPNKILSHGEVVKFSCLPGFKVVGTDTMRCWYGDWAVTGMNPECHPMPCKLPPDIPHGRYDSDYSQNMTIMYGGIVEYSCDPGYRKAVSEVTCLIGGLRPDIPECDLSPVENVTIIPMSVKRSEPLTSNQVKEKKSADISPGVMYQETRQLSTGKDITEMTIPSVPIKDCGQPPTVTYAKVFKNGLPLQDTDTEFPIGTNITYECTRLFSLHPQDKEMVTWQMRCENGSWPLLAIVACEDGDDGFYNNDTCEWRPTDPMLVTFYNDQELSNERVGLPPRAKLFSRCIDIGKFRLNGPIMRKCKNGYWTGPDPYCEGLSQEHNYALDRPPTILIRHSKGPIAQSNDGKLVVYPGTVLHLECLWVRRYGTPRWNVSQTITEMDAKKKKKRKKKVKAAKRKGTGGMRVDRKYPEGWTTDPKRNRQLEYRLSLYKAKKDDSGTYICTTPTMTEHMVVVDVQAVHCPDIKKTPGLHIDPDSTQMSTEVGFTCDPGSMLVGAQTIRCKPSGNWSAPLPHCEKVRCRSPSPPKNGRVEGDGPFHAGDMVQISCQPNYMMEGHPMIVCQQDGQWSGEVPKCLEACTYPGTIISGTMSSVKFYYGVRDTITYTCSEGFVLHGARHIECLEGARWSGPVPSCLPQT